MLSGTAPDPAWAIERATGTVQLTRKRSTVTVESTARIRVHTNRASNALALEVPQVTPDLLDFGAELFMPGWTLDGIEDESGAPVEFVVPALDEGSKLAFRPDRRLAIIRWAAALPADTARTLRVRWHQDVLFGRPEQLGQEIYSSGSSTPLLPALPRLAGTGAAFPYALTTWAPEDLVVAASGRASGTSTGPFGQGTRTEGDVGRDAVVAAGKWAAAQLGRVSVYADNASRSMAEAVATIAQPLSIWSGAALGETRFVSLPRSWRPPAAVGGEGLAGLRRAMDPGDAQFRRKDAPPPNLPSYATVLGAEGIAAASWAGRGAPTAAGPAWLWALGRAFALELLPEREALEWRDWLQTCARPRPGMRPALSPEVAATGPWRDISLRCAGPLVVGPMLDDRLGPAHARSARRDVLMGGNVGIDTLRAAILARDPEMASWVERWLGGGNAVRLGLEWTPGSEHVIGVLSADSDLAGAPVTVRFQRGGEHVDVVLRGDGTRVPLDVTLPFVPRRAVVDPDRRVLRDPTVR